MRIGAWQTAPLFDAVASGPPDNWSSSEIPWTDAAPRVWSIQRTRPSGGTWSRVASRQKHSELGPREGLVFFYPIESVNNQVPPYLPALATPSNWETSNPC